MHNRLPPSDGEWIDRTREISFSFEGEACTGFAGDTVSSALWAHGERTLGRSFKYHRPRGVYSMANHDAAVMVEDDATFNLRGDVTPISPGMALRAVNTVGSLKRDYAQSVERLAAFLPVGFYYKAFHTKWLFPFWERRIRNMAGLGRVKLDSPRVSTPKDYDFCQVLIVGGGPAGLAAAVAAAEEGLNCLLVDENPRLGGTFGYQWRRDPAAQEQFATLLRKVDDLPNLRVRTGTVAAGIYTDNWIALVDDTRLTKLRADAVVVATGAIEQPAVFHYNDLPGVMLASCAQRLIHRYAVRPFDRAVVVTANPDGYRAALDLHAAGVAVAAVADMRPDGEPSELKAEVAAIGAPIHEGYVAYEASADGLNGVDGMVLCPLNAAGQADAARPMSIACDGVAVSVGWAPADHLLCHAECRMTYDDGLHQFVPEQLVDGVFAAGRVNGVYELDAQAADGRRAALAAAAYLGRTVADPPVAPRHATPMSHPYPVTAHPKGKEFIDLDEDLTLADIRNAAQEGFDSVELLKRYAAVGMGPSQGKLGNTNAMRILAHIRQQGINETGRTTARQFVHPVSFRHLAGRNFRPERLTPLHSRHKAAGAEFLVAGQWLRPEYYRRQGVAREDTIRAEAKHVRSAVGLIDLGTLGKIDVCGPDAVEFLERLYTGRFANLAVGKSRYAVACDETGVVIDDGIVGRLGESRYYVSTTSGGAAGIYRQMQRWILLWELDVVVINNTGHYCAMNIAGPKSRDVLAAVTDVDLGPSAFPYLALREGKVADVPARMLRVGFVGELGYEIHVPSNSAPRVWDALIAAGKGADIRPFGVEAQRRLRLEKGHIILGQDTDSLASPYEAGLRWALKMDKPFFVGQRTLQVIKDRTLKRQSVGFMLPADHDGEMPRECHVVVDAAGLAGRVTSCGYSPALDRIVGLAYVRPEQASPGSTFTICVGKDASVTATVVKTPFYDPENARQEAGNDD